MAMVPGAKGSAVRARLAADNSPKCARAVARSALASMETVPVGGRAGAAAARCASWRSVAQSPRSNKATRRSSSWLGTWGWPGDRYKSMRETRKNSFQPRDSAWGVARSLIIASPWRSATR